MAATKSKTPVRKAHGVTPDEKARNLARLKRVEGQVRGIQKMVEEERYCADVLVQIAAVQEALRGVGKAMLKHHLDHCVTHAIRGSEAEGQAVREEILDLVDRYGR
jgi:DNA-binding FrmR family transcriptional regulator